MVPSWADQLLLQPLMEQFDTLPIQCRHIELMQEGVSVTNNNFWQNYNSENLDNFSLIRCLYMHRWCLHGPINPTTAFDGAIRYFAYTMETHWTYAWRSFVQKFFFWQNDSCENLDNFSLIGLFYMHRLCLHGPINFYYSFWWNILILCLCNVDTLNTCMKEFGSQKIIFDKITAVRT